MYVDNYLISNMKVYQPNGF